MKKLRNFHVGVDQGDFALFSDFETGGAMWSGKGPREVRKPVVFSEPFRSVPSVHISMSLIDFASATTIRADLKAEKITATEFEAVFRTWGDTRVARIHVSWLAIGEGAHTDDWHL